MTIKRLFGQFTKAAVATDGRRLLKGIIAEERLDNSGEIMDYDSSKPLIKAWSDGMFKASDGKSKGNVRLMHNLKVVGIVSDIEYDDAAKCVRAEAEVLDEDTWAMCLKGAYTGFSLGGSYAKKWADPMTKGAIRFTSAPCECSIVDKPCLGSATFSLVKADGALEDIALVGWQPTEEAVNERANDMAKAAGGNAKQGKYLTKARDELLTEYSEALLKADGAGEEPSETEDKEGADEDEAEEASEKSDAIAALEAAMKKAADAKAAAEIGATEVIVVEVDGAVTVEALAKTLHALGENDMFKGMWSVSRLASVMDSLADIQVQIASEAKREGDGSSVPGAILSGISSLGASLVEMAREEVAEMVSALTKKGEDTPLVHIRDCDYFACATQVIDMVKADNELMEKVGNRHNRNDATALQAIHDNAVAMGAKCEELEVRKAELETELDRMEKAITGAAPMLEDMAKTMNDMKVSHDDAMIKASAQVTELTSQLAAMQKRLETVENQEMPPKTAVNHNADPKAFTKAQDSDQTGDPKGRGHRSIWDHAAGV